MIAAASVGRRAAAIVAAILVSAALYQITGYAATTAVGAVVEGAVGSTVSVQQTLRWASPLALIALGVVVSFRSGYFNVGAQGQFYLGAIGATVVTSLMGGAAPVLTVALAVVAGVAAGALWSGLPGLLRIRSGADELTTTLMMNFVGALLVSYVTSGPLKDPAGSGQATVSPLLPAALRITGQAGISPATGMLVAVMIVATWWLVNRTAFGVVSGLIGRDPLMAMWQGARVPRIGIASFLYAGALAGLAGAIEVLGPSGRLASGVAPEIGFAGVLVALVGGLSVLGSVASALLFGALAAASMYLPIATDIPASGIAMLNGLIALLVTARMKVPGIRAARGPSVDETEAQQVGGGATVGARGEGPTATGQCAPEDVAS